MSPTLKTEIFKAARLTVYFCGALYLYGFSLSGVNVFGHVDWLIPLERVLCFMLSVGLWTLFFSGFYDWMKTVQETWKNEKRKKL